MEAAIARHPKVRDSVVIAHEDLSGEKSLVAYVVPEPEQLEAKHEANNERSSQWQEIWDAAYRQPELELDPTFNINGWNNSYTGLLTPTHEMREWVNYTVKRILALQPKRLVEIGCGTGLLLFRIAPYCDSYLATDISTEAVNYISKNLKTDLQAWLQVQLSNQAAVESLAALEPGSFDTAVLNSVVQYFPSMDYLVQVLKSAVEKVQPGGRIFIGDVRSQPLLAAFHTAVQLPKASDSLSTLQLQQRIQERISQDNELSITPEFFAALAELVFHTTGIEPEDLWNLIHELPYNIRINWSSSVNDTYDVVFHYRDIKGDRPTSASLPEIPVSIKPWSAYANILGGAQTTKTLIPQLRTFLAESLPSYMVPTTFVAIDSLPLTTNGKVDRRSLPAPNRFRPDLAQEFVEPSNLVEEQLAQIWMPVLSVEPVGIHDNFFDLGGHSLLTVELLNRIKETFEVDLPLLCLFKAPTIIELAQAIDIAQRLGVEATIDSNTSIDLYAESILDPTICLGSISPQFSNNKPQWIFLTGSTDFLGAFLLDDLLKQTSANIYCLVRAATLEEGKEKICNNLTRYLLSDRKLDSRIIPVLGDLSKPFFGLHEQQFQHLAIYRPGMITGHSQTGASKTDDLACRMVEGFAHMGSAPDLDIKLSLTPVDYVSSAIVHLSMQPSSLGKAFHLVNLQPIPLSKLVAQIDSFGYPVKQIAYEKWQVELINAKSEDKALTAIASMFTEKVTEAQLTYIELLSMVLQIFDYQNTLAGVANSDITCPALDDKLIRTYLSYLSRSGCLNATQSHDTAVRLRKTIAA